jgi:hypothetical protein
MRILAYTIIFANRIFASSHGCEIPNFLEIVAGSLFNEWACHAGYKCCDNVVSYDINTTLNQNYYKSKLENSNNTKDCWKVINELLNKQSKCRQINEIKVNGSKVTGDMNIQ